MLDAARAKPGELTLASVGQASTQHIAFEMLKHLAGVNMIFVPFNGNGPAVNALLGKHVDSVLVNYSQVVEQLLDGKFRALATTSRTRIDLLPQVAAPNIEHGALPNPRLLIDTQKGGNCSAPFRNPGEDSGECGKLTRMA